MRMPTYRFILSKSLTTSSLAFFEMRVLIARLCYDFDLELDPKSIGWADQKSFLLWEKPPMKVKLIPVSH